VLHPELKQENAVKEQVESKMISIPNLKQYEELKIKHPDAVLLFRVGDTYQSYAEDAKLVSKVLDLPRQKGEDYKSQKQADVTSFRYGQLDTYLPKLIRDGNRVAICDMLEAPKHSMQEDSKQETKQETKPDEKEEMRIGRHM
ncbi:MAG: DNA mismatch repair protein MutS, partial [Bacteroidia bacterium]|nr:DNA mismatch repair protein MutS [Bacteroidia bacterium]